MVISSRRWTAHRSDDVDLAAHQVRRQFRQTIDLALGPAILDGDVLADDVVALLERMLELGQLYLKRRGRSAVKKPDHGHRRLLRARRERPPCRRAA